jgi:hypothetical protein
MTRTTHRIPSSLPYLYEEDGGYRDPSMATVAQWRQAKRSARKAELNGCVTPGTYARTVSRMVKLADVFGMPDDVPLVPRLQALAAPNVQTINPAAANDLSERK